MSDDQRRRAERRVADWLHGHFYPRFVGYAWGRATCEAAAATVVQIVGTALATPTEAPQP